MKKSILFYLGAAILLAGCAKVEKEIVPEGDRHIVTLKATINEPATRVSVDIDGERGTYSWQAGDMICVTTDDGGIGWGITYDSGQEAEFMIELENEGQGLGEYAFYPASGGCGVVGNDVHFTLSERYSYKENTTNMPMLGIISSGGASFMAVGGLLELNVKNVPSAASYLHFSVEGMQIAGAFTFPDTQAQINAGPIDPDARAQFDYIDIYMPNEIPAHPMTFYIPLPCGSYDGFTVEIYDEEGAPVFSKTASIPGGLDIGRNQIIVAPTLSFPLDIHEYIKFSEETLRYFPELDSYQPVIRYYNYQGETGIIRAFPFSFESDYDWDVSISYVNNAAPWLEYKADEGGSLCAKDYVFHERTATMVFTCNELDLTVTIPIEEHYFAVIKQNGALMNGRSFEMLLGQSATFTAEVDIPQWMAFDRMFWSHHEDDEINNIAIAPSQDGYQCVVTGVKEGSSDNIVFTLLLRDKLSDEYLGYDAFCLVPVKDRIPMCVNGVDLYCWGGLTIPLGGTVTLTADVSGVEGEIESVSFVGDGSAFSIAPGGYTADITGIEVGQETIELLVKLKDGKEYRTGCDMAAVPISMTMDGVSLTGAPVALSPGQSVSLTASLIGIDDESTVRVSWGVENGDWDWDTFEYMEGSGPFVNLFFNHDDPYTVTLTAKAEPAGLRDTIYFMVMQGDDIVYPFQLPVYLSN
jgi:hypothetical protein